MTGLKNRRIVITGSSMGIGQAVAIRLAREGAKVVINARNEDAIEETRQLIQAENGTAIAKSGSVADYDKAGELIVCCVENFGGIDVLINCAGIAEPHGTSILDIDVSDWREVVDVHLHGTFNTCRHAVPLMIEQGVGTIINTSSHAFLGMYGGTAYAAGKGGVNSLSYAMAMDLKAHNINVNVVCPGAKTRLSTGEDFIDTIESLHSRGILSDERRRSALNPASPNYVASLYALLASDLASQVSGQIYWGSGGYLGRFLESGQEVLTTMDCETQPPWEISSLAQELGFS